MKTANNKKEFKRTGLKIIPKKVPAALIQLPEVFEEKHLPFEDLDSRISSPWGHVVAVEILNDFVSNRITKLKDTIRFMKQRVDLLSQGDFKARETGIDNHWLRENLLPCLGLLEDVEKFVAKGKVPNDKEWGALMAPYISEQGIRSTLTIIGKHLQLPPISTNAWDEAKYIRAKEKFISTHAETWIGPVIAEYMKFIERLQKTYEDKNYVGKNLRFNGKTKLTCLYVATRFLVFAAKECGLTDCLQVRQHHLNTFYTKNSISASFAGYFAKYLNKTGMYSFKFTAPKNKRTIDISDIFIQDEIDSMSEKLFDNGKYPQEKLLAIFTLFYAQSPRKVIKMPISRINIDNNGDMTFRFNIVDVPIHPKVAVKIREWLFIRDQLLEKHGIEDHPNIFFDYNNPLLPLYIERMPRKLGIDINFNRARSTAIVNLYGNGVRSARALMDTIGVSNTTAIAYMNACAGLRLREADPDIKPL